MLIREPAAGFKSLAVLICLFTGGLAHAAASFHLQKDAQGQILPFKAVSVPLPDFMREYSRLMNQPIAVNGSWDDELKGTVTLFLRHSQKPEQMTELVHRVLNDNGYAMLDAPAGNGWVIQRTRDARDGALPVYEVSQTPETGRLVTAYQNLKHADSESIARMMRSFMPAQSRIIPVTRSQLLITDTGFNIRKLYPVISRMDTPEAAKRHQDALSNYVLNHERRCGEKKIEKVVIENLEIQQNGGGGFPPAPVAIPASAGGKKK